MIQSNSSESQWLHWIEVQKRATSLWFSGNLPEALTFLDGYVESAPALDLKRQAIGFRGSLHQEQGDLQSAKADFLTARGLSEQPDFERCTLEESIAWISAQLGDLMEAERWYWQAIETASIDPRATNGTTLVRFLEIRGTKDLSQAERQVIEGVLAAAWEFRNLPGAPNFQDLRDSVNELIEIQRREYGSS